MKKIIFLFFVLIFLTTGSSAYAHLLKTSGSIGAVLHVDPNDSPNANEKADLVFEFKDTKNLFSLDKCDCNLSIYQGQTSLTSQKIYSVSDSEKNTAVISYTFPNSGVYTLKVTGKSTTQTFSDFSLDYDLRVGATSAQNSTLVFWGIGAVIIAGIIWLIFTFLQSKKKNLQS